MPLPKPKTDEDHDDFIDRCMGDATMVDDYKDADQRLAVCQVQWDNERSAMKNRERRVVEAEAVRIQVSEGGKPPKLIGYAALFNKETELYPGFREKIDPGAFTRTLREGADVRALIDHNPGKIIGRNTAETLELIVNKKGLKVFIQPPDTQFARDIVTSIKRGDVDQMSFGFSVVEDKFRDEADGSTLRTLLDVELFDVSIVTFPAYADTTIATRSLELWRKQGPSSGAVDADLQIRSEWVKKSREKRFDNSSKP